MVEKVGWFGVEPARLIAGFMATLMLFYKFGAPITEAQMAAVNEWLLIVLPIVVGEATRKFVYAKGKVDAVTDSATQHRIEAVTSQTVK